VPTISMYSPLSKWKVGDYLTSPLVHICISNYVQHDGQILLSGELMTENEIDEAVDHLRDELETFRKKAKRELEMILSRQLVK